MTECINTKPVTCRKGRKVPFAVTRHIYNAKVVFYKICKYDNYFQLVLIRIIVDRTEYSDSCRTRQLDQDGMGVGCGWYWGVVGEWVTLRLILSGIISWQDGVFR